MDSVDAEFEAAIPLVRPGAFAAVKYVRERLEPYRTWYGRSSRRAKMAHLSMRTCAVVGSCIVPVLINLQATPDLLTSDVPTLRIVVTCISMLVAINVALEGVFRFREQWRAFRTTEQMLAHEHTAFNTQTGVYHRLSDEDAFALLVDRAEKVILADGAAALGMLTAQETIGISAEKIL
jgi:hypothetical protein